MDGAVNKAACLLLPLSSSRRYCLLPLFIPLHSRSAQLDLVMGQFYVALSYLLESLYRRVAVTLIHRFHSRWSRNTEKQKTEFVDNCLTSQAKMRGIKWSEPKSGSGHKQAVHWWQRSND